VSVVESANFRKLHHRSEFWRLYSPRDRRVFLQGKVRACPLVVCEIRFQNATQTAFIPGTRGESIRTRNVIVGTTTKSAETKVFMWFFRKVRQFCDGGFRCRTMYFATVVWDT
jgi:hypothetical protein